MNSIWEIDSITGSPTELPVVVWGATQAVYRGVPAEALERVTEKMLAKRPTLDDGFRDLGETVVVREDDHLHNAVVLRLTGRFLRLPWDNPAERQVAEDCGYAWRE